jgi:hypothetical protein
MTTTPNDPGANWCPECGESRELCQCKKSIQIMNQQHSLFMYRLMHIIEVASLTRETNPAMQEIMDIAGGSRDAEMIESGVV